MMAEIGNLSSNTADFLPQFKAVGQSLKKRFFRKPNISEAIEQYESLCQELQREDQKSFAAVCCLEAAKCQESLRNHIQQANLLTKAGKLFLGARNFEKQFEGLFSDANEHGSLSGNLELGVQSLNQAAKVYRNHKRIGLAFVINIQIGEVLYLESNYGEALKYYKTAFDIAKSNFTFVDQVIVTELIIKAKVKMTEFESVLKTVNDMLIALTNHKDNEEECISQFLQSTTNKFEILRVVLILILGGNSVDFMKFIGPDSSLLCHADDKETGKSLQNDDCSNTNIPEERRVILLNLKSLVVAIQHGSVLEINDIRNALAPHLNESHHDLINFLIQMQS